MICKNCGNEILEEANTCPNCGVQLKEIEQNEEKEALKE